MVSNGMVLLAKLEPGHPHALLGRSHSALMETNLIRGRRSFPSFVPRGTDREVRNAPPWNGQVSASLCKTSAPKQLASAGDMLDVREAVIIDRIRAFFERRSNQSQCGIFGQFAKQEEKVVFVKGDVCVQAANCTKVEILDSSVPCVKGMNFSREMPFAPLGHPNELDPWVIPCVFAHNLVRAIGRTVANDDPFDRPDCLHHHRPYGETDELSLVARGSDEDVSGERQHGFCMNESC